MTPAEVQKVVSDVLSVPLSTVGVYARFLREQGLLSKAGRGRSAARMGARDAAHLVIAICSSNGPGEGPDGVNRFYDSSCQRVTGNPWQRDAGPEIDCPVDAITDFIERVSDGRLEAFLASQDVEFWAAAERTRIHFRITEPVKFNIRYTGADGSVHNAFYRSNQQLSERPLLTVKEITGIPLAQIGLSLRAAGLSDDEAE